MLRMIVCIMLTEWYAAKDSVMVTTRCILHFNCNGSGDFTNNVKPESAIKLWSVEFCWCNTRYVTQ